MMKNLSKWILPLVVVSFAALLFISYTMIRRDEAHLVDDLDRRARMIVKGMSPTAVRIVSNPPNLDEEKLAERFSGQGRLLGIVLCGTDGTMVARSEALSGLIDCTHRDILKAASSGKETFVYGDQSGRILHTLAHPLAGRDGNPVGVLGLVHDAAYIRSRVMSQWTWTALMLAILALLISVVTYSFSRRSFQRSVDSVLKWIGSEGKGEKFAPTIREPILKPVAREVERLTAHLRAVRETAQEISRVSQAGDLWTASRLKSHAVSLVGDKNLIVVSNREPYMHNRIRGGHKVLRPASGLVTAVDPILRSVNGLWIAHGAGDGDRDVTDERGKIMVPPESPSYTLKRVWLTKEEEEGYYYGFSNEALWPLCHMSHNRPEFDERDWKAYVQANRKFADAVVEECGKDPPFVLVQDYHFTLLPRFIREKRPDAVIGLFWHIPWPTPELFWICPWKGEILEGMLSANFIGFHLQAYCNNFLETANDFLPVRIDWDRFAILHERGFTTVKPFPISVQPWAEKIPLPDEDLFRQKALAVRQEMELRDCRIVVSVDRVDYTKGIPDRLKAIDLFFERHPRYCEKVVFVQMEAPSRVHIPRYRDLGTEMERLVDEINWKHARGGWQPIVLLKAHHEAEPIYTLYRMADVCVVSSLADGMNLVAKEYVAAREGNNGVLVLSEFTGAARELTEAILVNPYDRSSFAEAIRQAIELPAEEQKIRMERMRAKISENNVYRWAADLLSELARSSGVIPFAESQKRQQSRGG